MRRPALKAAAKRTQAPIEGGLGGRAIALLVILASLALGYAIPLRTYFTQVSEINELRAAQEKQRRHIEALTEEEARWHDDRYVEIQVRRTLYWVRPGETPLIPIWGHTMDTEQPPPAPKPETWYETLWSSVDAVNG